MVKLIDLIRPDNPLPKPIRFQQAYDLLPTGSYAYFGAPTFNDLVSILGKIPLYDLLSFTLIKTRELVNVPLNLTQAQIDLLKVQIPERYPDWNPADIKSCMMEGGVFNAYGEIKWLDPATVFSWLAQYSAKRYAFIENKLISEKDANPYVIHPQTGEKVKPVTGEKRAEWLEKYYRAALGLDFSGPKISEQDQKRDGQYDQHKDEVKKVSVSTGYKYWQVGAVQQLGLTYDQAKHSVDLLIARGELRREDVYPDTRKHNTKKH